jgi:protein ImuB
VEARVRPDPQRRPIVVFDPTRRQRPLLEVRDAGLSQREAEARWPDVAYRADAPADYAQALVPVLDLLAGLSPTVEWSAEPAAASAVARHDPTARYAIFLDGTGLAGLYGSEERLARLIAREVLEQTGHRARVGIADGRYAALLAATLRVRFPSQARVWPIVPPDTDAAFLAGLPVACLSLPPEVCERVARLGAQTLGEFVKLPSNALRHRFGPDGLVAKALAAGRDEGPLRPRPVPLQLHDTIDLEWVETSLDRLLFLLKRLTDRLSVRLAHHGLGCGRLRVSWLLDRSGLTTGDDPEEAPPPAGAMNCAPTSDGP